MKKLSLLAMSIMPFLALPIAVHANPSPIPTATPVPEPATIAAGAICLIPLAVGAVRAFRKDRK